MKQALALLVNDLHVTKDNVSEFNKNWDEALSICRDKYIYDIVVGGDVFTSRAGQTLNTLLAVRHAVDKAYENDIALTIAEGNHDLVDQEVFEGYNHIFNNLHNNTKVIDRHMTLTWDDCDYALLVISYFPEDGSFMKYFEEAKEASSKVCPLDHTTLYIHQGIHGALGDLEIPGELPNDIFNEFKEVLVGHYHNRCNIKGTNIQYIGSSRQHNFGEDEMKGYTIFYDDGTTEFVQNQVNTRYTTLEADYDDMDRLPVNDDPRYKVRVKINCTEEQAKTLDRQKLLDLGINKIETKTEKVKKSDKSLESMVEKYDKHTIVKAYTEFCDEKRIDSELGVKYLQKIQ